MMKKLLFFTLLRSLFFAQQKTPDVYENYPKGQNDYNGGNVQFYKELHELIVDKKIQPCENKDELYLAKFIVYPDATIKLVEEKIEEDKCAYNLIKELAIYLKGWKPAEVEGKKVSAVTKILIFPDALFDKYSNGYDVLNYMSPPNYKGGINKFRVDFMSNVSSRISSVSGGGKVLVAFDVNEKGEIENIRLDEKSGNTSFDDMIINSIRMIRGKWSPGMVHGVPVKNKFQFPVNLNIN
ncbi:energy transducer TonB [Elizabethkingia meningoseptica]|uniref:energy transducer TonB n=1 Tax=Elizabethkingia meningoseptica TaxID=238 RepID=UPI002DD63F34|nr:energy transducer TonB [Elizabethkingia meningoseptica]MEC4713091.1 energy transducer TonB [Elizabethkingia meningoseptica]